MPIEKIRILSLMVLSSSFMTWHFGDYGPTFFVLQILAIIPLWFPINLERIRQFPIWKLLGIMSLAFFGFSSYVSTWEVGIFVLVLFCVVYEFYGETRRRAPIRLISLVSFLIIVYMGNVDTGLTLLFGLMLYISSVVFCLLVFYLGKADGFELGPLLRTHYMTLLRGIVFSLVVGVVLFWCLPRTSRQALSTLPSIGGNHISGFGDRVTLNDIGSLKLSRKHVMDLKPLDGKLHSNYLKGRVMDYYENGTWSSSRYPPWIHQSHNLTFDFWQVSNNANVYSYQIDLEPLFGNNLFFFDTLVQMEGRLHPMRIEGPLNNLTVYRSKPLSISYTMSAADSPSPNRNDFDQRVFLDMPANHEYVGRLAGEVLGERREEPIPVRAELMRRFFLENYEYTLDIDNAGQIDPLDHFLNTTKAGHCEFFASSMTLMLRSQGIPARLVTGFLVPELHPSGGFYYITESDAHAWVEYLYEDRWHTIDPTPAADFVSPSFFETSLAYLERQWRAMVVTFDFDTQKEFFAAVLQNAAYILEYFGENPWFVFLIFGLLAIPFTFFKILPKISKDTRETRIYRRLERLLISNFEPRAINEGMVDYVKRIQPDPALELDLIHFLHSYHRYRFGPDPNHKNPDITRRGKDLIKRLEVL